MTRIREGRPSCLRASFFGTALALTGALTVLLVLLTSAATPVASERATEPASAPPAATGSAPPTRAEAPARTPESSPAAPERPPSKAPTATSAANPAPSHAEGAPTPPSAVGTAPAPVTTKPPEIRWRPPGGLVAADNPNDNGHGLLLHWTLSPDDDKLLVYEIGRVPSAGAPESAYLTAGTAPRGSGSYVYSDENATLKDAPNPLFVPRGEPVTVRVRGRALDGSVSAWSEPASGIAVGNWFHTGKTNILVAVLLFGFGTVWFIVQARRGKTLYIRPIAGVNAVDEAIGRATEMGRPILFVPGIGTAGDIASIAGFTILARVAKRTAEYQTPIRVPLNDPVMLAVAQEVVKEAYLQAGRPEVYRPESVFYISAMQFPYVAAVNGLMLREKTATNFYMGVFYAESLLLAETGNMTGSIQISGTDQVSQIPFFVAATDYTLIGEELYAASASLSQDPVQMGPLKAQDWAKVVIMAVVLGAIGALTFFHWDGLTKFFHAV